jgi:hypothetical protein
LVQFGEPFPEVREHGLEENTASSPADAHAVTLEPELTRQTHSLAPAVSEKLGGSGHCDGSSLDGLSHWYIPTAA